MGCEIPNYHTESMQLGLVSLLLRNSIKGMNLPHFRMLFEVFACFWVGGWGFFAYRYPEFFARMNARFGAKRLSGPRFITFTRRAGIFYMVMAIVSVVAVLVARP